MRNSSPVVFDDRVSAGLQLGLAVARRGFRNAVVLGLPRGGVPVAAAVAQVIAAPLDVIVVRKLGVPGQPEVAMGAIGEDGAVVMNDDIVRLARVGHGDIDRTEHLEREVLERRLSGIRAVRPRVPLAGCTAVLVDDGIATGATMRAAVAVARAHGAHRVVVAAPVAPPDVVDSFARLADDVVLLEQPSDFVAVGAWYRDFDPVSDHEVISHLQRSIHEPVTSGATITCNGVSLAGDLTVPEAPLGVVLFAHGSGSSRHSPRNCATARLLERGGIATLLIDLQTPTEAAGEPDTFDAERGTDRLVCALDWLAADPRTVGLPVGLMGASTGAALAIRAAVAAPSAVAAVVSRGGRVDLAPDAVPLLRAPALCIVGSDDDEVLRLNRRAVAAMTCRAEVCVVEGATHLFSEPGTLEAAAVAAFAWFQREFAPHHSQRGD